MATDDSPFLSRWSQRKVRVREGLPPEPAPPPVLAPVTSATPMPPTATDAAPPPLEQTEPPSAEESSATPELTLEDVSVLTRESDFSGFVARGVGPEVRNAALKKLFTDPHFSVMDGLDTYIEDYGLPDPLPEGMLRKMVQSQVLGLFANETPAATEPATEPATETSVPTPAPAATAAESTALPSPTPADEDADLQLQPDDALGRQGPEPGPGEDAGRQH